MGQKNIPLISKLGNLYCPLSYSTIFIKKYKNINKIKQINNQIK